MLLVLGGIHVCACVILLWHNVGWNVSKSMVMPLPSMLAKAVVSHAKSSTVSLDRMVQRLSTWLQPIESAIWSV
jgi:hypothetical protein